MQRVLVFFLVVFKHVHSVYLKDKLYEFEERRESCRHKIFIYNLTNTTLWDVEESAFRKAWNSESQSGMKNTEQWSANLMLIDRVRRSKCRVQDPNQANIFMIPILPNHKLDKEWRQKCGNITESQFLNAVPYMTKSNACRHFVFIAKTHRACTTGKWYYDPKDKKLRAMLRFAYDAPLPYTKNKSKFELYPYFYRSKYGTLDRCRGNAGADRLGTRGISDCQATFPHVYSVPYPSSIHWRSVDLDRRIPTASLKKSRKRLMVFVGHIDKGEGRHLRKKIDSMGKSYRDRHIYYRPESVKLNDFIHVLKQSTFCLQPGGDSPGRKSISDAIALGCIPVFFGNVSANQYSWFYPPDAHVNIDLDLFMEGKIDLKKYLQAFPPRRLYKMRKALAKSRKAFTYNIDDFTGAGDAADRIFDLVDHHAHSVARCQSAVNLAAFVIYRTLSKTKKRKKQQQQNNKKNSIHFLRRTTSSLM